MTCRETETLLPLYHDGEATPAERERVEAHLAECPACRKTLEALRRADAAAAVPDPGPGYYEGLSRRVMERLRAEEQVEPSWIAPLRRPPRPFLRWGTLAAAAMVLLVAGGIWLQEGKETLEVPSPETWEAAPAVSALDSAATPAAQAAPEAERKAEVAPLPSPVVAREEAAPPEVPLPAPSAVTPPGAAPAPREDRAASYSQAAPSLRQSPVTVGQEVEAPSAGETVSAKAVVRSRAPSSSPEAIRSLLEAGRSSEAETEARSFLARNPEDPRAPEVHLLLVRALRAQGKEAEASAALAEARSRYPSDPALAEMDRPTAPAPAEVR